MSQRLRLNVDDASQEITDRGVGARIEIQRDATDAFLAPASLGPMALVAGQDQYEFFDGSGTTADYYRFRLTSVTGTVPSEWSAPFRGGASDAYATLESLREHINPPDNSQDNLLSDLLVDATEYINAECQRDFFRHPGVSGTEVRLIDGSGTGRLRVKAGIVSLTSVELATATGQPYSTLAATDWAYDPSEPATDFSYSGLRLSDVGTYSTWYPGLGTARLTGVFGWASVPGMIRKATLDLAREWYRQGPGGGGPVGVNQFGTPIFGGGMPLSVKQAIERYGWRQLVH